MNDESHSPAQGTRPDEQASSRGLAALSRLTFDDSDVGEIFREATAAVDGLASCQVEASYRSVNGGFVRFPPSVPAHPDIQGHRESGWDGHVDTRDGRWGWAFPLSHRTIVNGCLVVSSASAPSDNQIQLLTILAQQTGAALAHAALHDRDSGSAAKLTKSNADLKAANRELGTTVTRLQRQTNVHETLSTAMAAGMGEQGIADALNRTHNSVVESLTCELMGSVLRIVIETQPDANASLEIYTAEIRKDLFEEVFKVDVSFSIKSMTDSDSLAAMRI